MFGIYVQKLKLLFLPMFQRHYNYVVWHILEYPNGHIPGSIFIGGGEDAKFASWLGALITDLKTRYPDWRLESDLISGIE